MLNDQHKTYKAFSGKKMRKHFPHVTPPDRWIRLFPFSGNAKTHTLHRYGCANIEKIAENNRVGFDCLSEAAAQGYTFAQCCA
ncbi:hypothetical protein PHAMO_470087 [Magnetospirillum molischianum DSM 120]|uniref:Uncharacterized protein n=1 Tax=Magnetospirillum molischianum DSM 120 TaxID=1150626 RepID=H8FWU8_MAGML|nr:hypothetical protein PHAMO_470087 [Magnetospirillum molischianum DSM 120]